MRRINLALVVIAVLTLVGTGVGLGLAASAGASASGARTGRAAAGTAAPVAAVHAAAASVTASAAGRGHSKYVVADCFQLQVRPSSYVFTCADGNVGLQGVRWTTWSSKLASGYGSYYANDCTPNCAAGHVRFYPALVVLWGSAAVKGHPDLRRFTEFTLIFTGKRPPQSPVTQTFAAPPPLP